MTSGWRGIMLFALAGMAAPGCTLFKGPADTNCKTHTAYKEATAGQPLQVPSGLQEPPSDSAIPMPAGPREAVEMGPDGKCLQWPPSYYAVPGKTNDPNLPVAKHASAKAGGAGSSDASGSDSVLISGASVLTNEVAGFLRFWAEVWTSRNAEDYFAFYTDNYAPPGYDDHWEWMSVQRDRFKVPATTEIDLKSVDAVADPNGDVTVKFVQRFGAAPDYRSVLKEMQLKKGGKMGGWTITSERIVDVL